MPLPRQCYCYLVILIWYVMCSQTFEINHVLSQERIVYEMVGEYPSQSFFWINSTTGVLYVRNSLQTDSLQSTEYRVRYYSLIFLNLILRTRAFSWRPKDKDSNENCLTAIIGSRSSLWYSSSQQQVIRRSNGASAAQPKPTNLQQE